MADMKTTDTKSAPAEKKPETLSAESAFAAAASAKPVSTPANEKAAATETNAASKPVVNKAPTARKAAPKAAVKSKPKKTVKKGSSKMTTAKKTAKTGAKKAAKAAKTANKKTATNAKNATDTLNKRFENLTATTQERAKEAAERAVEISKSAAQFNRANVEALLESGKITAEGARELGKTNVKYTRENLSEANRAFKGAFNVATPRAFFDMQADYVRSSLDRVIDQTSTNRDAVVKLAGKAYQPIADRVSKVRKEMKKAA